MIEKMSSHSTEIERVTRASEMALRKANMNKLMSEPHKRKLTRSSALVGEFVETLGLDSVYVSTSGGKDSACLSRLCKAQFPTIKHVMFDTGLEYRMTVDLARKQGATKRKDK